MKRVGRIIANTIFICFIGMLCYMIFLIQKQGTFSLFGHRVLRVISSSMEPTIEENTCILIKDVEQSKLQIGDIITFRSEEPEIYGYYNTHRIYDMFKDSVTGEVLYITKGDFVEEPDTVPVHYDQILGRYDREFPYGKVIGKLLIKLSNSKVYFVVIILPLIICLLSYIKQIVYALVGRDNEETEMQKEDALVGHDNEETEIQEEEEEKNKVTIENK